METLFFYIKHITLFIIALWIVCNIIFPALGAIIQLIVTVIKETLKAIGAILATLIKGIETSVNFIKHNLLPPRKGVFKDMLRSIVRFFWDFIIYFKPVVFSKRFLILCALLLLLYIVDKVFPV